MDCDKKTGYYAIIFLSLIPAIYWLIFLSQSGFSDFQSIMRSIGKLLGLTGIIMFSLTFLLNTRLRITEKIFAGLDSAYRAHHIFGTTSFLLILFHPLFLASQFLADSAMQALLLFFPINSPPVMYGLLALLLMIILLFITFYLKWKYQKWKFSHQFLGVAFVLACIHVMLIPSDVAFDKFLRYYIFAFMIIGISSYCYRTIFWRQLAKRYDYHVKNVKKLSDDVTEVTLEPDGKKLDHLPGQFSFVSYVSKSVPKETHPFTISSSPHEIVLRYTIKALGDYTILMPNLKPGETAKVEAPFGKFSYKKCPSKKYIWIAGGIGITPFLSMVRSLQNETDPNIQSIDLYYSVKEEKEALLLDELKDISTKVKFLNIIPYYSNSMGRLNAEIVLKEKIKDTQNLQEYKVFICGPPVMMYSLKYQLVKAGLKRKNILTEEFGL